jgi:hypothetical protein
MIELQQMIHNVNPFVQKFAFNFLTYNPCKDVTLVLRTDTSAEKRRYNVPISSEVAVIMPGDGNDVSSRDIVINSRDGFIRRLNKLHPLYDPLHYVLLFPI